MKLTKPFNQNLWSGEQKFISTNQNIFLIQPNAVNKTILLIQLNIFWLSSGDKFVYLEILKFLSGIILGFGSVYFLNTKFLNFPFLFQKVILKAF